MPKQKFKIGELVRLNSISYLSVTKHEFEAYDDHNSFEMDAVCEIVDKGLEDTVSGCIESYWYTVWFPAERVFAHKCSEEYFKRIDE